MTFGLISSVSTAIGGGFGAGFAVCKRGETDGFLERLVKIGFVFISDAVNYIEYGDVGIREHLLRAANALFKKQLLEALSEICLNEL